MKQTWRVLNYTLGKRNQKTNLPISIEHNNTLISDPNKIANIGTHLAENICEHDNNEMYQQCLQTQSQCCCTFEKINGDDILKIINKMDNKSISGYYGLSNKIYIKNIYN